MNTKMKFYIIPVTIFNQNCSIVWDDYTNIAVLIDPGGEASKLKYIIKKLKVIIKEIWLTHGHVDHVGAAYELAIYYNVPIIGPHYGDKKLLDHLPEQCIMFGVDNISPLIPNSWLIDNSTLHVGNLIFQVLHCPGHSPGHVVFLNKISKFIFMGDVLFRNGIGRTDLPGGNMKILINTIHHKLLTLPGDISFLPGHGPISSLNYERKNNIFLK